MTKKQEKEKLVEKYFDMFRNRQEKKGWDANDLFDVAYWFVEETIYTLADMDIIPKEDLQERIKYHLDKLVEDVFRHIRLTTEKTE